MSRRRSMDGRKRKRLPKSVDLISSLPDDLLLRIISLLDMKQAVVTGILSRRWKRLWCYSPSLTFDDLIFYKDVHENSGRNFIEFVERYLSLHIAPKISAMRLYCSYDEEISGHYDSALNDLIDLSIFKGVEEIDLGLYSYFEEGCSYSLPPYLFQCERLVSLSLRCCKIKLPSPVRFSSLLVLRLKWIVLDCEIIQAVFDGCPLLEELVISECIGSGHLCISSCYSDLPLKRLTIDRFKSGEDTNPNPSLEICAPNLQFLKLSGYHPDISLKGLQSLSEAYLDLRLMLNQLPILESLLKYGLSHVKFLRLSNWCIQVMSLATLQNLHSYIPKTKCLLLETEVRRCEFRGIANLLYSSHNIETLIIKLTPPIYDIKSTIDGTIGYESCNYWDAMTRSFPCLVQNLKIIKITGFMDHKIPIRYSDTVTIFTVNLHGQVSLLRFLLKSAVVLEKMIVQFSSRPSFLTVDGWLEMKSMSIETLKGFSRASAHAELMFL